ncbi:MAG: excinuclease ABC subunit UvrC [Bacteroidaceae bacterium]|jgi:excinuclease ABC subunit C|nr:excinuclease ABC subunit UvrC [Bacteroidaceae bacterium]
MNKEELQKYLKAIVSNLPEKPGCYQYLDDSGTIIYVGKAKNLKRRVASYFNHEHDSIKTRNLVAKIRDIRYLVVNSESDALLLENNLIKQWTPKYNILLKDGKTYPSICVTNEYLPRIIETRKIDPHRGTYYGPYSHVQTMHMLLDVIRKLYPLRRCTHTISPESIAGGKHKECLEYHIKNCTAPCTGRETHERYMSYISDATEILKGNTSSLEKRLQADMQLLAAEMRFEEAEIVKRQYLLIKNYRSRSEVVSNTINDVDVFNIEDNSNVAYINYLHVANGCINKAFTFEYAKRMDETTEELLVSGIVEMRSRYKSSSKEIIVPFHVELPLEDIQLSIPQRGDKKKLLELSRMNVLQYKKDRMAQSDKLNPEQKQVRLMKELKEALGMTKMPLHIECFDNSNISGTDAVAGCVVFKKARPCKNEYHKYNIKTVEGPDDYASMQEVVRRRYSRMINESTPLPDLIITDGGKGQMEVVRKVIEDELELNIPIAGLAKNNHHRTNELLYGFPTRTIQLRTDSSLFHFLTQIQDEVHRYAITFHRDKRSKRQTKSELDSIPGIGPKTKDLLLRHFRSVKRIKDASPADLKAILGENKSTKIYQALHNN